MPPIGGLAALPAKSLPLEWGRSDSEVAVAQSIPTRRPWLGWAVRTAPISLGTWAVSVFQVQKHGRSVESASPPPSAERGHPSFVRTGTSVGLGNLRARPPVPPVP